MIVEVGRLVYDVKCDTVGDKKVLNNRLAIALGKDRTTYVDVVAWGSTAELIEKHFHKGYEIYIEGHLINKKRKKDEVEFETIAINIDSIKFTNGNPKVFDEDVAPFLG